MSKNEWRKQDEAFLRRKDFVYCCMKKLKPEGGMPDEFGLISPDDILTVHDRKIDAEGDRLTGQRKTYKSFDEMFDDGWVVD